MDWSMLVVVVQLVFLEGVLSIDNAAVLGAMASPLPIDQPVPWPPPLRWLSSFTHGLFGMQREAALKVGLLGAYAGRFLMLLAASFIVNNPWLRIIGALYLIYLAVDHIAHLENHDETSDAASVRTRQIGFWSTVAAIELADLAFSLDNVVAAITLSDHILIVMLGVGIGILAMRFAATVFTRLILWEPALQTAAYLLVFCLGIELVLKDIFNFHIGEWTQFALSTSILLATVLVARSGLRDASGLWRAAIAFFKALYAPFALVGWVVHRLLSPFRRHANPV